MITKPLSPFHAVTALAVFGAGLLAGMWLFPETLLGSNAGSDPASNGKPGMRPTKLSQRDHEGRALSRALSRFKRLASKPLSAGLVSSAELLSEEQLTEFIAPDEVPHLLAALLQQAGVMGFPKLFSSHLFSRGEKDSALLRDLVHYYYRSSPDEAIEWMKGLSTERERKLMARMLINALNSKAPGSYYHENRQELLVSLRPLAREFPSSFDRWVKQSLMMYSVRGKTDGFVEILEFEAEFRLGTLRDDWTLEIRYDFNYIQAINEFNRINQTLSADHRMTLPSDFHSQWEKSDAEAARAWRGENPDWNSQE